MPKVEIASTEVKLGAHIQRGSINHAASDNAASSSTASVFAGYRSMS
jgi:hypothetical protein